MNEPLMHVGTELHGTSFSGLVFLAETQSPVVTNWHFSRSFRLIFHNAYDLSLSRSYRTKLLTLVQLILSAHYVHR